MYLCVPAHHLCHQSTPVQFVTPVNSKLGGQLTPENEGMLIFLGVTSGCYKQYACTALVKYFPGSKIDYYTLYKVNAFACGGTSLQYISRVWRLTWPVVLGGCGKSPQVFFAHMVVTGKNLFNDLAKPSLHFKPRHAYTTPYFY